MPTIKLEDGTSVEISQQSYDELAKAIPHEKEYFVPLDHDEVNNSCFYLNALGNEGEVTHSAQKSPGVTNFTGYFKTQKEAQKQAKRLIAENKIRRLANWTQYEAGESKWYVHYNTVTKKLGINFFNSTLSLPVGLYFKDGDQPKQLIQDNPQLFYDYLGIDNNE